MAINRFKIIYILFLSCLFAGTIAYAKSISTSYSSVHIGIFNSQKQAQVFFESLPPLLQKTVTHDQLWLNKYESRSGFTEHHLEIFGLSEIKSKDFCAVVELKNVQCFTSIRTPWKSKTLQIKKVKSQNKIKKQGKLYILKPLGFKYGPFSNEINADIDIDYDLPVQQYQTQEIAYNDFTLKPKTLDTVLSKSSKDSYIASRDKFIDVLKNIGNGLNAGQGKNAVRDNLLTLGRDAFEAAGSSYLSDFLEKKFKTAKVLSSDASSGKIFASEVQNNLIVNATKAVEGIISETLSAGMDGRKLSDNFLQDTTDGLMLAGAKNVIDSGLKVARQSDLYALRHLELEYNLNNFKDSYLSVLATQPIYQTSDLRHNIFLQGGGIINENSVDIDDDVSRHTLNLGLAYRYLTVDEKHLLGANIFYDHQWPYNHKRMSLGVDAKAQNLGLSANYYIPLSDFIESRTDSSAQKYEEKALEGYDVELDYQLPFMPNFSVFGKGYKYFRETDDDLMGMEIGAEYSVNDNFTIKGSLIDENGGRDGVELMLQYSIPLYDVTKPNMAVANMQTDAKNASMRTRIFEKVRRENRIRVEEKAIETDEILTVQFNAASIGLPFDVGGNLIGALIDLSFDTAITVPNGDFAIINFSNGSIANVSASGVGDVILEFNATTLTVTATNGGFVQFISASGGISTVNVPGGVVNLLGTDIDVTDNGVVTTIQVRAGAINVVPAVGVAVLGGNQADVVSLTIATGATSLLVDPALETRQEDAYTNLDLINPDPPATDKSAPFINVAPQLITGPQFIGNNADLRFTFTQPVSVTGVPQIDGLVGINARTFIYDVGASTTSQLVFRYVYVAGDVGAASITIQDLDLNGGTIKGVTNNLNAITAFTDTIVAINDLTAPSLIGSTPVDNEPLFSSGSNIVLTFDENIQAGIGNITITDTTDGSSTTIIPIGDAQISIVGAVLTINPTGVLDLSTDYDITIPSGVIEDTSGNDFAGIVSGNLNFTTSNDITPPSITGSVPADNATGVALNSNIVLTFDEAVNTNVGNIEIRRVVDNVLLETIDVTTALMTGTGTTIITINPANDYPFTTEVYVLIDAGAFQDLVGNNFAGIAVATTLNFRGFRPSDVAGNLLWLDAHDLDGDGASEGAGETGLAAGDASVWGDKSGNNNDMSHGTPSRRPTLVVAGKNGRDILNFDGGDALFATDASVPTLDLSNNEFTMLVVINPTSTTGRILINKESSYEVGLNGGNVQAAVVTTAPGSWAWGGTGNNALTTAWHSVEFDHNNTTWDFYQDGVLTESIVPANNQTGNIAPSNNIFTVGARGGASPTSAFFIGDFAEVLMFDHALTAGERVLINTYLTDKWGL